MKNLLKLSTTLALFMCILFLPKKAQAQFQVNLMGSHLSSAESGSSFNSGLWGGGATLRYFISPQLAVGVNGRYFTRDVGVETGLYQSTFEVHLTNSATMSDLGKYVGNNFGVGPKVGLQYGIGPSFGVSIDASYNFIFDNSNTSKTILLGAGIFYTFGRK